MSGVAHERGAPEIQTLERLPVVEAGADDRLRRRRGDELGDGDVRSREGAQQQRLLDVWYLPDVGHTAAIREPADEYERRVTAFFDAALTGR